jgi:hypothetical protein
MNKQVGKVSQTHSIEDHLDQNNNQDKEFHYKQRVEDMFHSQMVLNKMHWCNIEYHLNLDNNPMTMCQCNSQN